MKLATFQFKELESLLHAKIAKNISANYLKATWNYQSFNTQRWFLPFLSKKYSNKQKTILSHPLIKKKFNINKNKFWTTIAIYLFDSTNKKAAQFSEM